MCDGTFGRVVTFGGSVVGRVAKVQLARASMTCCRNSALPLTARIVGHADFYHSFDTFKLRLPGAKHTSQYGLLPYFSDFFQRPPNLASLHILPRVFLRSQQVPHKAASRTRESSSWACQGTCLPQSNMEPKRGSRRALDFRPLCFQICVQDCRYVYRYHLHCRGTVCWAGCLFLQVQIQDLSILRSYTVKGFKNPFTPRTMSAGRSKRSQFASNTTLT